MHYRLIFSLASSVLFAACTESEQVPMPGTPEAMLQRYSAEWKANEKRSFIFEAVEWNQADTTTFTCESLNGAVGVCLKARHCCGGDAQIDTVNGYVSPTGLFERLRTDVGNLDYDDGQTDGAGFTVHRRGSDGLEIIAGISATFHPDLGYPRTVVWFGGNPPSGINITRLEFR